MKTWLKLILCAVLALEVCVFAESSGKNATERESTTVAVVRTGDTGNLRIQGEQRFHANCGRCHAAPQKFSPRVMKTVLRHMRVRATITDDDMRMILFYMTQ
jgi:cytochrome c5